MKKYYPHLVVLFLAFCTQSYSFSKSIHDFNLNAVNSESPNVITGNFSICLPGPNTTQLTGSGIPDPTTPWFSSNPAVATVDYTGLVTAVSFGMTTITYKDNLGNYSSANVYVSAYPTITSPTGIFSTPPGTTLQLQGYLFPDPTTPWTSSNPAVATIDGTGLLTGISNGTCVITYKNLGGCTVSTAIIVDTNASCPDAGNSGVISVCNNDPLVINLYDIISDEYLGGQWVRMSGEGGTFDALAGTFIPDAGATSSDFMYMITGISPCSNDSSIASITIISPPDPIVLAGSQNICVGATTPFFATTSGGTWTTSNPSVASVNPSTGIVTGIAAGNAEITYLIVTPCGNRAGLRSVSVSAPPTQPSIEGWQGACVGSFTTFMASQPGGTWSSSDTGVALVDETGFIVGISPGTATIFYTIAGTGGCSNVVATRTVVVPSLPVVTLTSDPATAYQEVCFNSAITPIVYNIGPVNSGASGANVTGLPPGVSGSFDSGVFTISGTATIVGTFPYTVTTIGWCGNASISGTITVTAVVSAAPFCDPSHAVTPNSVVIDWEAIPGVTDYQVSYSINSGPDVLDSTPISNYEILDVLPGQSVSFTLTNAIGISCFQPASITCANLASESFDDDAFQYFPNPVSDVLNLVNPNAINNVIIINTLGQVVWNKSYDSEAIRLDLSGFESGNYFCKVTSGNASNTFKIIKK